MSFRNAYGIYHVIREHLEAAQGPLTCVDLFDSPDVKKFAVDANRVSDYLGHMYRRGLLDRHPAPRLDNSSARFAYSWKQPDKATPQQRTPQPRLSLVNNRSDKPTVKVVENDDGSLTFELSDFFVTVKCK